MTTPDLTPLLAATPKLVAAGAPVPPWWGDDAWCDLTEDYICSYTPEIGPEKEYTAYCPPAVEAAVVAYATVICGWFYQVRGSCGIKPTHDGQWEVSIWIGGEHSSGIYDKLLAAAEALILAVAGEVGDE